MALPTTKQQHRRPTPIETTFNGYKFRSRLEARWAVFFDTLGLQWEYEPEGFKLDDGVYYLPDFRVTSPQKVITWYEIKAPNFGEESKMPLLEHQLTVAQILENADDDYVADPTSFVTLEGDPYSLVVERSHQWSVCPRCGLIDKHDKWGAHSDTTAFSCWPCDVTTPSGGGHPFERGLLCEVTPHKGAVEIRDTTEHAKYWNRVNVAASRARRARFEHGATP